MVSEILVSERLWTLPLENIFEFMRVPIQTNINKDSHQAKPYLVFRGKRLPLEHTRWLLSGVTLVISFYSPFLSGVPIMILTVLVMARNFTYGVAAKLGFAPDDYLLDF